MNSDEPALVPQWLQKGGPPGSTGGHNSGSSSQFSLRDPKSRPKRETPVSSVRTNTTGRDAVYGRPDREPVRRDRSSRDSWTASALGSTSASSYRSAAPASVRNTRQPPERQVSDNSRSNAEGDRQAFGPASSARGGVFRTQSGPPNLRDREDFGFGSVNPSYHDNYRFQPVNGRGPLGRGTPEKPPFEKDFPSLAGRSNASKPWLSGNAPPAEQPWTRLADAPDGGALSPRGASPGPNPSPRLSINHGSQAYFSPGHAVNGEPEGLSRPSMSKLIGGEPPVGQPRMADTLQQGVGQSTSHAPSHDKARLEELVIRQSKQLVPVVASTSARDKGKAKGPASAGPKLAPGGGNAGAVPLGARGKSGLDGKRTEDSAAGPVMTGLGPSLRRLPSVDARTGGTSTSASQPEGTSDAGDSTDGNAAGSAKQPAAKEMERQRTSFFQSLRRSSKNPQPNPNPIPAAAPPSPPSPPAQQSSQPDPSQDPTASSKPVPHTSQDQTASTSAAEHAEPPTTSQTAQSTADNPASTSLSKGSVDSSAQQGNGTARSETDVSALQQQPHREGNGNAPGKGPEVSNGHKVRQAWDANDPQLKVPAEEEAFLRSLGWTEPGDDEDEGLTEEEIAAFKANTQHLCIKSFRPSAENFSGLNASFLRPKVAALVQGATGRASQFADISSSDSESDF